MAVVSRDIDCRLAACHRGRYGDATPDVPVGRVTGDDQYVEIGRPAGARHEILALVEMEIGGDPKLHGFDNYADGRPPASVGRCIR